MIIRTIETVILILGLIWATFAQASSTLLVANIHDSGTGSLRDAILTANRDPSYSLIRFDSDNGPFTTPQVIRLASPLPILIGDVEIDGYIKGRLWKPSGVTIDGGALHRIAVVAKTGSLKLRHITLRSAKGDAGGALANYGELVVDSVTFQENHAIDGGAIYSEEARLSVVNATFISNSAQQRGGGIAVFGGSATITNATLTENKAIQGGAIYSNSATTEVSNSILANSNADTDCYSEPALDPRSTHNIIEAHSGCGKPISQSDPRLGELGQYNGPTQTIPLRGNSPAINFGSNEAAKGNDGEKLIWDQRGNGDPRFAVGITDIGAFERQPVVVLNVDISIDIDKRGCTRAPSDCSLRGAIAIANTSSKHNKIGFDRTAFPNGGEISPQRSLPAITRNLILEFNGDTGYIVLSGDFATMEVSSGIELQLGPGVRARSKEKP